jgi:peptide/nickel transport system substrate-binding protein
MNYGTTGGGGRSLTEIHSNALITEDNQGAIVPRLAAALPSVSDDSWVVNPDGTMRTTWKLRSDVTWHDGTPFTAADVVLGWRVAASPQIPVNRQAALLQIANVEAADAHTVVIAWTNTFFQSLLLTQNEIYPLPQHLLGPIFDDSPDAFINLPFWTSEWLHTGPFRLVDFGLGENLVFDRFDDYFLGPARVKTMNIRVIGDPNTMVANLRSGALDIVTETALPIDLVAQIRDEWAQTGEGTVFLRRGSWAFASSQNHPEWGWPPEIRDPRTRRALTFGLDTEGMRHALLPGFRETEADTFMASSDPRAAIVGKPFARYRYDPRRAVSELAEVGWQRGISGRMTNPGGEQVQITVRASSSFFKAMAILAQNWRDLGIDVTEEQIPASLITDDEYRAKYPAFELTTQGYGDGVVRKFHSANLATPQNRYKGSNTTYYQNPAFDDLVARLYSAIDARMQGEMLREIGEILATDMPALPLYFNVNVAEVRKGIRALSDDYDGTNLTLMSRNAHLWDRH